MNAHLQLLEHFKTFSSKKTLKNYQELYKSLTTLITLENNKEAEKN